MINRKSLIIIIVLSLSFTTAQAERIGYFFGTFNPIHKGHLWVVKKAKEIKQLDIVFIIPTPATGHNDTPLPYDLRYELIARTIAGEKRLALLPFDLSVRLFEQGGTAEVITYLFETYPDDDLFHIMGADSFERFVERGFYRKYIEENNPHRHLIISTRKGYKLHPLAYGQQRIFVLPGMEKAISSTAIRRSIIAGNSEFKSMVPRPTYEALLEMMEIIRPFFIEHQSEVVSQILLTSSYRNAA